MRIIKAVGVLLLPFVLMSAFAVNKGGMRPVYVMGVSLCFGDSVIYFTDIQQIDSVRLTKEGFLPSREGYGEQLKSYLTGTDGNMNHTCITYFAKKRADLQKKATKLMKRYQTKGTAIIRQIPLNEFRFVRPEE